MHVDHTPTQKALRAELRTYFAKLVPPEVRAQIRSLEGGPLQLNHERIGLAGFGASALQRYDEVLAWARETTDENGLPVAEKPWVQIALAEAWARLEASKVWNWRIAWELEQGRLEPARASAAKVYSSETLIEVYRLLLDVLGEAAA